MLDEPRDTHRAPKHEGTRSEEEVILRKGGFLFAGALYLGTRGLAPSRSEAACLLGIPTTGRRCFYKAQWEGLLEEAA